MTHGLQTGKAARSEARWGPTNFPERETEKSGLVSVIHSKAKKWGVRKGDQRRANVPERKDEIGIELHPVCISISRLIVTDKETGCRGEGPEALDRDRLIGLAGTGLESR